MPDGSQSSYYILENQVLSPELAKQYQVLKPTKFLIPMENLMRRVP